MLVVDRAMQVERAKSLQLFEQVVPTERASGLVALQALRDSR